MIKRPVIRFQVSQSRFDFGYDLIAFDVENMQAMCPFEMKSVVEGERIPVAMVLPREQAQGLADALWDAGIRQTQANGSVGQLGAVERHLDDLRKVAFHGLGIK